MQENQTCIYDLNLWFKINWFSKNARTKEQILSNDEE